MKMDFRSIGLRKVFAFSLAALVMAFSADTRADDGWSYDDGSVHDCAYLSPAQLGKGIPGAVQPQIKLKDPGCLKDEKPVEYCVRYVGCKADFQYKKDDKVIKKVTANLRSFAACDLTAEGACPKSADDCMLRGEVNIFAYHAMSPIGDTGAVVSPESKAGKAKVQ
jgi:hypothetical protein